MFQIKRRRAFTLIEILVVISIIALLSGIVLSAFNGVRNQACTTTCASNLQQLSKAFELYAQDNRGFYPSPSHYRAPNSPVVDGASCFWATRIESYVRSEAIFECPSQPNGEYRTGCPQREETADVVHWFYGSYRMVSMGYSDGINQVRLRNLSASALLVGNDELGAGVFIDPSTLPINTPEDLERRGVHRWHGAGDNLLFADGHVKWMSLETMVQKGRNLWLPAGAN